MRKEIIASDEIIFSYTESKDLKEVLEIERNKENSKYVFTWSKERHLQSIESEDEMHLLIQLKDTKKIIGYAILSGINSEDKSIEFRRIVIVEKGKGYGRKSVQLIKKICFEKIGCHRLWLDVYEDNIKAINLYESEGFVKEGILRECKKCHNSYRSMLIMSILEHEYKSL